MIGAQDLRRRPAARDVARARLTDALPVLVALVGFAVIAAALVIFQGSRGAAYDFRAYDAAARRIADGLPLYAPETQAGPFSPGPGGLYLYPPPLAVLLLPLTALGTDAAAAVWQLLHVVALAGACALLPVPGRIRLSAFGVACLSLPTLLDLNLGNVSTFVLLAGAIAWRWRDGAPGGIGAALAAAVRPQVGLQLAWWAALRRWSPFASAAAAAAVLVLVTLPFVGLGAWEAYARLLVNLRGAGPASSDVGFSALAYRAGAPDLVATLAFAAGAAVALLAAALITRRDPEAGFVSTLMATLLVVPLLWPHYLVLLVLPAAFLAARGWTWAIALPLLAWLPDPVLPWVALLATIAPALTLRAADRDAPGRTA